MKLSDLKSGDTVIADEGFTCLKPGPHVVKSDEKNCLYVCCEEGSHFLDGQEDKTGNLIGFSFEKENA